MGADKGEEVEAGENVASAGECLSEKLACPNGSRQAFLVDTRICILGDDGNGA